MTERIRIVAEPGKEVCDFCWNPSPVTAYQCPDFMWAKQSPLPQVSEGAWAACAACADLIDREDWHSLTHRAFDSFLRRHEVPFMDQPALFATMQELHRLFRDNYKRAA